MDSVKGEKYMNNTAVQVNDVWKVYKIGRKIEVEALKGVSLEIEKGEFMSIMGPSGSGKSTLLNLIGGLDIPTEGKVTIEGTEISKMKERQLLKIRREKVGFVFQFYNLLPYLTALENVMLSLIAIGAPRRKRKEEAKNILEQVGLGARLKHKPGELSGGEQQRVAIARALVSRPAIVLADEPTGDLDTKTGMEIIDLMKNFNQELEQTFIIVTHDHDVSHKTERIIHLRDGKIERVELS